MWFIIYNKAFHSWFILCFYDVFDQFLWALNPTCSASFFMFLLLEITIFQEAFSIMWLLNCSTSYDKCFFLNVIEFVSSFDMLSNLLPYLLLKVEYPRFLMMLLSFSETFLVFCNFNLGIFFQYVPHIFLQHLLLVCCCKDDLLRIKPY